MFVVIQRMGDPAVPPVKPSLCCEPPTATLTIFSPSPIHLLVRDDAEMEKNVASMFPATALPMSVLPVPGGLWRQSEKSALML